VLPTDQNFQPRGLTTPIIKKVHEKVSNTKNIFSSRWRLLLQFIGKLHPYIKCIHYLVSWSIFYLRKPLLCYVKLSDKIYELAALVSNNAGYAMRPEAMNLGHSRLAAFSASWMGGGGEENHYEGNARNAYSRPTCRYMPTFGKHIHYYYYDNYLNYRDDHYI
jgi:hypothetical protein